MGSGQSSLEKAAISNNLDVINKNVNDAKTAQNLFNYTIIRNPSVPILDLLVQKGANPLKFSSTYKLVEDNNINAILYLLKKNVSFEDSDLELAISSYKKEITDAMLQGNIKFSPGDSQPLWTAVNQNNYDLVKKLIEKGSPVADNNKISFGPYLVYNDANLEIIKLLLQNGLTLNDVRETYINFIISIKNYDILGLLIKFKLFKPDNKYSKILLLNLLKDHQFDLVQLLYNEGVELDKYEFEISKMYDDPEIISFLNLNNIDYPKIRLIGTTGKDTRSMYNYKYEQVKFLNSLTLYEKQLLSIYTEHSGYKVINEVLRQNVKEMNEIILNPTFMQALSQFKYRYSNQLTSSNENKIGLVKEYIVNVLNIFKKAPPLKEELTVYRGVQREEDIHLHGNELLSTSYDKDYAKSQFQKQAPCCLLTITLKPGIRTIWIEYVSSIPIEHEILIGPPFQIELQKVDSANYNVVISRKTAYRTGARRRTYRRKNKGKKTYRKTTSY